ncbi:MAG: PilN domain-containing protein [Bacillota bacterium]
MRHQRVIGLDRDGETLYLAEVMKGKGGPLVLACGSCPARGEEAKAFLAEERREGRFLAVEAAAALGRTGAVQKELELPPLSPAATRTAALAALEDGLPFPPAEVCLGCRRRGRSRSVFVVAARRAAVEEQRSFLVSLGLRPRRLDLRPAAVAVALRFGYGPELAGRAIVLELRAVESTVLFLREGRLEYAHPLPGLGREESEEALSAFCRDLRLALALRQRQDPWEGPFSLWLTGPAAARPGMREAVAAAVNAEPEEIRLATPRGLLRRPGLAPLGPEAMAAVGLSLLALGLDEAPPDLLAGLHASSESFSRRALALPLGLAFVFVLAASYFLAAAAKKEADALEAWLAGKEEEILRLQRCREESAVLTERLRLLTEFGREAEDSLELLLALHRTLPPGTRLTRIAVAGDRVEALEGVTPSLSSLLESLAREPLLSGLRLHGRASVTEGEAGERFILAGPLGRGGGGK